ESEIALFEPFDGIANSVRRRSFELIYCKQVLEHIRHRAPLLAEVCRVLMPSGWFGGSTSQFEPYDSPSLGHYTPIGLIELLSVLRSNSDGASTTETRWLGAWTADILGCTAGGRRDHPSSER